MIRFKEVVNGLSMLTLLIISIISIELCLTHDEITSENIASNYTESEETGTEFEKICNGSTICPTKVPSVDQSIDREDSKIERIRQSIDREDSKTERIRQSIDGEDSNEQRQSRREYAWGRRSFGSLERFRQSSEADEWVAYFMMETVIVVLQSKLERRMKDCVVIEVRQEWEQEAAFATFGLLMELIPLDMRDMIYLITLCGKMHPSEWYPKGQGREMSSTEASTISLYVSMPRNKTDNSSFNSRFGLPASPLIFPGTLWCGVKDRAEKYEDLGEKTELDRCCRAHDHCPIKLSAFERRYGVNDIFFTTRSHCSCEIEFYHCLKQQKSYQFVGFVANFYFNLMDIKCLDNVAVPNGRSPQIKDSTSPQPPYDCTSRDELKRCRMWRKDFSQQPTFSTVGFKMKF